MCFQRVHACLNVVMSPEHIRCVPPMKLSLSSNQLWVWFTLLSAHLSTNSGNVFLFEIFVDTLFWVIFDLLFCFLFDFVFFFSALRFCLVVLFLSFHLRQRFNWGFFCNYFWLFVQLAVFVICCIVLCFFSCVCDYIFCYLFLWFAVRGHKNYILHFTKISQSSSE